MPKVVTLNSNSDYRRLYGRGKSYANPALVTYVLKNRAGICRIGITCSKKVGNSVERNRSKRLVRAAFAEVQNNVCDGYDIVFVTRVRTRKLKSWQLTKIINEQLQTAGVLEK